MTQTADLIIKNARELVTLSPSVKEESGLGIIEKGAVAAKGEKIVWIGQTDELPRSVILDSGGREIDAAGKVVMPGFIDSHTHVVFAGSREGEFEQRIQGLSYLEIAARGGGILSTVEATRQASFDELVGLGKRRLDRMLSKGVTTVEGKSGYGLTVEDELKILSVMRTLNKNHPVDIVPPFWEHTRFLKSFVNGETGTWTL
jgi:imidazolonepropionase